jgi:hypothetical protein
VLPIPEATDAELIRTLFKSPDSAREERFDQVVVFTADQGLVESVQARLERAGFGRVCPSWCETSAFSMGFDSFSLSKTPLQRRPIRRPSAGTAPVPPATRPVGIVSTAAAAAWAAGRLVEPSGDLASIASRVEAAPALLTQVGPTERSLRGSYRLLQSAKQAPERVAIERCSPEDGLEVYAHLTAPERASGAGLSQADWSTVAVAPSPLGPGAVRVSFTKPAELVDSFGTRLPFGVVEAAASRGALNGIIGTDPDGRRPGRRALDDTSALSALAGDRTPQFAADLTATFHRAAKDASPAVVCKLELGPRRWPEWWWVRLYRGPARGEADSVKGSIGAKLRVEHPLLWAALPEAIREVRVVPVIHPTGNRLVFRAPSDAAPTTKVVSAGTIPRFQIGAARSADGSATALLMLDREVDPGVTLSARCIQEVKSAKLAKWSNGLWEAALFERLKALPLMVALPTDVGNHVEFRR